MLRSGSDQNFVVTALVEELPPCGIYRTLGAIGAVPAGRLVYFHNHGEPGPGIYLPASWKNNRAQWQSNGSLLGESKNAAKLAPLAAEGFYRVKQDFYCCKKNCRAFQRDLLVQLGYNAAAEPILFTPVLSEHGVGLPETGSRIDRDRLHKLDLLRVVTSTTDRPKVADHLH